MGNDFHPLKPPPVRAEKPALEFHNSVGGAPFLEKLFQGWEAKGWTCARLHVVSETDYRRARSTLARLRLRWRMYPGFAWRSWWATRRRRAGGVIRIVTTNPFFAPWLIARAAGGRGATINLVYDLFPDALVQAGFLLEQSWLARRCAAITRGALRNCAVSIFLGRRLQWHAERHYGPARRAVVIPVGADGSMFRDSPPAPVGPEGDVTLLYSGQLGRMHDHETIRKVMAGGLPPKLKVRFHASGPAYTRLRREAGAMPGCEWGGPLAEDQWRQAMLGAQAALVTIAAGGENIVMPSKTYSALVAGQAIVAVCAPESDLADLVRQHDCGWVVAPGDEAGLGRVLAEMTAQPEELLRRRRNAFAAGHTCYDVSVLAADWERLFQSLTAD